MAVCNIAKGLYVGGQASLEELADVGVSHILSVTNYEVAVPYGICHWHVSLEDSEHANLLAELPGAVTWLERALRQKGTRVLVHCQAGTSRSVSVVLGLIMKAKHLDLDQALALVRSRCPAAEPNSGFMRQLALWGDMGWALDEEHPEYKRFQLEQVAHQYEEEGWVDPSQFADLPSEQEVLQQLVRYRCRKCRQVVATSRNVIPADAAVGNRNFGRRGVSRAPGTADAARGPPAAAVVQGADSLDMAAPAAAASAEAEDMAAIVGSAGPAANGATGACAAGPALSSISIPSRSACSGDRSTAGEPSSSSAAAAAAAVAAAAESGGDSSLFLEPMFWMQETIVGVVQGKLYCPNCQARLGSFNWSGITNTSGGWVTPAFQLHLSRVDRVSPQQPAALAGMRFPAALAEKKVVEDLLQDLQVLAVGEGSEQQEQQLHAAATA